MAYEYKESIKDRNPIHEIMKGLLDSGDKRGAFMLGARHGKELGLSDFEIRRELKGATRMKDRTARNYYPEFIRDKNAQRLARLRKRRLV